MTDEIPQEWRKVVADEYADRVGLNVGDAPDYIEAHEFASAVLAAVLPLIRSADDHATVKRVRLGHAAALDYAEKLLLGEAAVEAASRAYEPATWEGLDAGHGRDYERRDALDDSRVALSEAFRAAREGEA